MNMMNAVLQFVIFTSNLVQKFEKSTLVIADYDRGLGQYRRALLYFKVVNIVSFEKIVVNPWFLAESGNLEI